MKKRIRKLITGIMTASILSQFLSGTVSMAAGIDGDSGSSDSAVVLEESVEGDEGEATDAESVEDAEIDGDNANASNDEDSSATDRATGASDNDEDSAKDDVNALSGQNNEEDLDVDTVSAKFSDNVTSEVEGSEDDLSSDGSVSSSDNFMTVSFGDAGVVDILDSEDDSDDAKEESDSSDEKNTERGVLESELSGEPYIFDYDSFRVEWKVVSHWEGACNVSVSLTNKSDETIHNWNLSFLSEDEIINPYNARITSEGSKGNKWTFKNLEYNQDIRPGESVQFGFQVKYGERVDIPYSYSIDSSEKNVAGGSYEITNTIISSWNGGFVGEIRIVNNTDTAIEDWTVTVRTKAVLVNVWGGTVEKASDNTYELKCPDYAQNIAAGQTSVIGYQMSGCEKDIEILGLNEWTSSANKIDTNEKPSVSGNSVSGNTVSDNTVSDNSISENSVSNNTISENSVSDNSVSENKPVYIENDGHQHIFIDSDEYELLDEGIYLLDVYSDSVTGYIDLEDEIESVDLQIQDLFEETVWEGDVISADGFNTWSIDDTGFVLGANKLIFEVTFTNGTMMKEELIVINREASNIDNTYIEFVDEDGDNIYDYYEKYFGTDPDKKDTDGDGLDDGAELFLLDTDPTDDDTDGDGIRDCDEDEDSDGLNVLREYELGTSNLVDDYDLDGLSDGYEANVSGTDPTLADTDFDGLLDKEELDMGLNPLDTDSDDDGIPDGKEIIMRATTKEYTGEAVNQVGVNISCSGSMVDKIYISKTNDKSGILYDTAGLIGDFYDIECDAEFDTAEIIFNYDESMLGDTNESDLRLIWYNEETREFVLLENSVVDTENNTISYTTTHFSKWGVVDSKTFKDAFDTPASSGTNNPYFGNEKLKYVYDYYIISLDLTASADDIEKQLQVTQAIIDQMDGYDYLNITCYGSENTLTQPYYVGDIDRWPGGNWPTDGKFELDDEWSHLEEILDYRNNNVYIEEGATYSGNFVRELNRTVLYRSGNNSFNGNTGGKNYKVYIFYSGSLYDEEIEKCLNTPNPNSFDLSLEDSIKLAEEKEFIINTISIAAPYGSSEYMDELVPVTGGKSYSDADGTGDGLNDLINEVIKDLDYQKAAQRQGDIDGDGLPDGHELDGMLGENGHIYYSDPYNPGRDTDGDTYPDVVEMGEYDPTTGTYKMLSNPMDPNSIPGDAEPVYIIAWSYGRDEVKKYEEGYLASHNWETETSCCDTSFLTADGDNSDWIDEMWEEFDNTCSFSRAAQTKKKELIEKGVAEEDIKFFRVDGGQELLDLWNDTWTGYKRVQELHLFSHGKYGTPEMYGPLSRFRTN